MSIVVKNLKYLRNQKGISQQQLAAVLGVSQQSVNKYENHNVEPDIATLVAMADYFGTTIDCMVGRCCDDVGHSAWDTLTLEEKQLIADYRRLSKTERACVDAVISTYKRLEDK